MQPRNLRYALLLAALALLPATAQGQLFAKLLNPQFDVRINHPPEVILKGVTKVSVLQFTGDARCGLEFAERLAMSIRESSRFEVIDRGSISAILREQGFQSSGAVNGAEAVKLGELLGPAAIFSGRVTRCSVEVSQVMRSGDPWRDRNGVLQQRYIRRTTAHMTASVSLIDLTTAKVYAGDLIDVTFPIEHAAINAYPEAPSEDAALSGMYQQAVYSAGKMILPWSETVKLTVYDDAKCDLKASAGLIKAGDFDGAIEGLQAAIDRSCDLPENKSLNAKALYNLGIALTYSQRPGEGLKALQASAALKSTGITTEAISATRRIIAANETRRAREAKAAALGVAQAEASEKRTASLLTNEDVISMASAKLSDAIILTKINGSPCRFDTSTEALIALKGAGVSDAVVLALTEAAATKCK